MAQRADRRSNFQSSRNGSRPGNLKPGRYYVVHSDQLYSLEPVDEPMTYENSPKPLGPMDPMSEDVCNLEPAAKPIGYGPDSRSESHAKPTGFFLDRYVY
jgi:hypothetical protein